MAAAPRCRHCGTPLPKRPPGTPGLKPQFCANNGRCRKRAYRRRKAGLPEHAYPAGARRGPRSLGEATQAEVQPLGMLRVYPIVEGIETTRLDAGALERRRRLRLRARVVRIDRRLL